jgi:glutamate racemase
MKIGVFDSGLGGLVITKAFIQKMPEYDYFYYGDSRHLPYGEKTAGRILNYTLNAIKYMIANDCKTIIIACNTATSIALRYIQQRFIPKYAPDIKVLGVVIPTVEVAVEQNAKNIGVVATTATAKYHIYKEELFKLAPNLNITEIAASRLVPAIESNNFKKAEKIVKELSQRFLNCDSLILGCTHYPLVKNIFRKCLPGVNVVSQDEFMGDKIYNYLKRHEEIESKLSKNSVYEFQVSSLNRHSQLVAATLFPEISVKSPK